MISSLLSTIAFQARPKGILDKKKTGQSLTQRNYVRSESELCFPKLINNSSVEKNTFEVSASKVKTRKSASKRYKVTPSGKVLHRRPGKAHLNGPKSSARKNRLSHVIELGKQQLSLVRTVLPYSKLASKRK
jgi:large subunit ribosomal protein L35